jgi:hypothetical protein
MPAIADPPAAPATLAPKPVSPAPSAPRTPTPAPAPKPKADAEPKPKSFDPTPDVPDSDNEFFQAAQKLGIGKKPAEPKADEPAPDAVKPPEPDKKAEVKPPEAKADPSKPESDNPKDLRFKLSAAHKELEEHKKRLAEYETKSKETKPPEEVSALSKQLSEVQKQLEDARNEIGMITEGKTPEFKKKHQEPFNAAYGRALKSLSQLKVDDGKGGVRPGNSDDLGAIFRLPLGDAIDAANDLFGANKAQAVMQHYFELHKLNDEMSAAEQELKANWQSNQEKRQAEATQQREAVNAGYLKAKEGLTQKHPEWFGDDGSDPEVTKALSEGKRLWSQQPKTFQEHVTKAAAVELAMTAHPRLVYQLGKAKDEIASLTEKLKEFQGSEPSSTKRKTEAIDTSRKPKSAGERDQELRDLLANAR